MSKKSTYCVCSKQANEKSDFGRMPVPAEFKTLEEAKLYRRELNLRRGAYHPGYVIQEKEDSRPLFTIATRRALGIDVIIRASHPEPTKSESIRRSEQLDASSFDVIRIREVNRHQEQWFVSPRSLAELHSLVCPSMQRLRECLKTLK